MICHSVLSGNNPNYERMARVLTHTMERNSPDTPFVLHRVSEQDEELAELYQHRPAYAKQTGYLDNARKTKHWTRIVQEAPEGEVLCLLDTDMMVLGDLSDAELLDNDMLVTIRPPKARFPMNSGVVFLLVNEVTRRFFRQWFETVCAMLADFKFHQRWKTTYGGTHQAAYGYLTDPHSPWIDSVSPVIGELHCTMWNCETACQERGLFDEHTKAVHIIGNLRRHLFNAEAADSPLIVRLAEIWRGYEREAIGAAA